MSNSLTVKALQVFDILMCVDAMLPLLKSQVQTVLLRKVIKIPFRVFNQNLPVAWKIHVVDQVLLNKITNVWQNLLKQSLNSPIDIGGRTSILVSASSIVILVGGNQVLQRISYFTEFQCLCCCCQWLVFVCRLKYQHICIMPCDTTSSTNYVVINDTILFLPITKISLYAFSPDLFSV